jgi:WD40 repeat protein
LVLDSFEAELLMTLSLNGTAVELKEAPNHDVLTALTADGTLVFWDLKDSGQSYMELSGIPVTTFAITETQLGPEDTSRLDILVGTSGEPQLWVVNTGGSNGLPGKLAKGSPTLLRNLWNGKALGDAKISSAVFSPDSFIVGGSDGTVRVLSRTTGALLSAVSGDPSVGLTVIGVPSDDQVVTAADDGHVAVWYLDSPETSTREAPMIDCRLVADNFETLILPGRLISLEKVECDVPEGTEYFDRRIVYRGLPPNPVFPSEPMQLQVRSQLDPAAPWIPIAGATRPVIVIPEIRVLRLVPDMAIVTLLSAAEFVSPQELQFMKATSEIDGLRICVLPGMHFTLQLDPVSAAEAIRLSSAGQCRLTSTGPSKTSYLVPLTWPENATAQCGPLSVNHSFPTLDALTIELTPNGIQWFKAPSYVTLFEAPHFVALVPPAAAVHTSRWITIQGFAFPLSHNVNITVEMPPGFVRRAVYVNSTALRFRSPKANIPRDLPIWVTFGTSFAIDTQLTLQLTESPTILNVTPSALTIGDSEGIEIRKPINIYGEGFSAEDSCLFQSTSMTAVRQVPLYAFMSSGHVQCKAPSLSPVDAALDPPYAARTEWCEVQSNLSAQLENVTGLLNAIVVARTSGGSGALLPGYEGVVLPEEENATQDMIFELFNATNDSPAYTMSQELRRNAYRRDPNPWNRLLSVIELIKTTDFFHDSRNATNGTSSVIPTLLDLLQNSTNTSNGSSLYSIANLTHGKELAAAVAELGFTLTDEEVGLLRELMYLQFNFGVALIECAAMPAAVVESQPLGGYMLVSIFAPALESALPSELGYGSFAVRLLPGLGIASVHPNTGPVQGGTLVAVYGAGFTQIADISCAINDTVLVDGRIISDSLMYCTMPAFSTPGVASVKAASRNYELSYSSVPFTYYPRWSFRLDKEPTCFSGEEGDSVVVFVDPAEFSSWTFTVYKPLCLFTVSEPQNTAFVDTTATIYAWNYTMRIVCPCPSFPASLAGREVPMYLTLDGKNTMSPVEGGSIKILKRPVVTETLPTQWTVGQPLNLNIYGRDFPEYSDAQVACVVFDDSTAPFEFTFYANRLDGQKRGLVGDLCPEATEVTSSSYQWTDVNARICNYAAWTNWSGALAIVPAIRDSASVMRCEVPVLPMSERGSLLPNRSVTVFLAAKKTTVYLTQLTLLPKIQLIPPLQIERVDPFVFFIEKNAEVGDPPAAMYIRVYGEAFYMNSFKRARKKSCRLNFVRLGRKERELSLLVINDIEVVCVLPQSYAWSNHEGLLSLTLDGEVFSNEVLVYFIDQLDRMTVTPSVVPPLTRVAFNLTGAADTYAHADALQNISDLFCDFGPDLPQTPAYFIPPPRLSEDTLSLNTPGTPNPELQSEKVHPVFPTWICHSPDEGFPPGIDLVVALTVKIADKVIPTLSNEPVKVIVQPSFDAARMVPTVVMAGASTIAEMDLAGSAVGLTPLCKFEGCPSVDVGPSLPSNESLIMAGGRVSCQLPEIYQIRAGTSGTAECKVHVSLNGGHHWSTPGLKVKAIAEPTLFDAYPFKVMADIFCVRCIVVNLIGSHLTYSIDGKGTTFPSCRIGTWKGSVIALQSNVTTCAFYGEPGSAGANPQSNAGRIVPWAPEHGFFRVSFGDPWSNRLRMVKFLMRC